LHQIALGVFFVFSISPPNALAYPEPAVHVITPLPAGGAADVVLRLVKQKLSEALGTPFVVENKAGAGGGIGSLFVSKAEADEYTLLLTSSSAISINPLLGEKSLYNPFTDFTPIVLIGSSPNVLVVNSKKNINTLSDLITQAKVKPVHFSFTSNDAGTLSHLTGELFNQYAGVTRLHVPYKGAAPAVADTVGGQVNALFSAYTSVKGMGMDHGNDSDIGVDAPKPRRSSRITLNSLLKAGIQERQACMLSAKPWIKTNTGASSQGSVRSLSS